MLRNLNVGTKLVAVVAAPILVLMAIAGVGTAERLARVNDADRVTASADLVLVSTDLAGRIQTERAASLLVLAGGPVAGDALAELRAATDEDRARYVARSAALASDDDAEALSASRDRVLRRLGDLDTIRAQVDQGGVDTFIASAWFGDTADALLQVDSLVARATPVPDLAADLATVTALGTAREASARADAVIGAALVGGPLDGDGRQWREISTALATADRYLTLTLDRADPAVAASLRSALSAPAVRSADAARAELVATAAGGLDVETGVPTGAPVTVTGSPSAWSAGSAARSTALAGWSGGVLDTIAGTAQDLRDAAAREAFVYVAAVLLALAVAGIVAVLVARRTTRPLRELTTAAEALGRERLPALVERLRTPGAETDAVALTPLAMDRTDEIGQLADAFDAVQRVTLDVAEQQAQLLRTGMSEIFVNLARRNQVLLNRQIEHIDRLEAEEQDPDVLSGLFTLDHLATRMRRNAESLLVLAGADAGHRRARPSPVSDVVRAAIGEVDDYDRVHLLGLDDALVVGGAAVDVAHLLAELMENATTFSPPTSRVEVLGHVAHDGGYVLTIADRGLGMTADRLDEANELLANPPLVGLALSRSLGLTVVARLATRVGIEVRLAPSPAGGITAVVRLGPEIISVDDGPGPAPPDVDGAATAPSIDVAPSRPLAPAGATRAGNLRDPEPSVDPGPRRLADALPDGAAFDAGLSTLLDTAPTPDASPDASSAPAVPTAAGAAEPDPETPALTAAGLRRRVPGAAIRTSETGSRDTDPEATARAPHRSPEEVRATLARYRSGLRAGRLGQPSDALETEATATRSLEPSPTGDSDGSATDPGKETP